MLYSFSPPRLSDSNRIVVIEDGAICICGAKNTKLDKLVALICLLTRPHLHILVKQNLRKGSISHSNIANDRLWDFAPRHYSQDRKVELQQPDRRRLRNPSDPVSACFSLVQLITRGQSCSFPSLDQHDSPSETLVSRTSLACGG